MNEQNRAETRIKAYEIRNARILSKLDKILRWCEDNKIIIPENVLE